MSAATETAATAPLSHVEEVVASHEDASAPALEANTTTAGDPSDQGGRDHIERDVSNILAGLNQEQLASIVAAARTSEARGDADGTTPSEAFGEGLPPGLGQAASALTSIASGFKRTPGNNATALGSTEEGAKDLSEAPAGEYQEGANKVEGEEEMDEETNAAIAAVKNATDTATAAAIASLGSLAAASHLQQHPSSSTPGTHSLHNPADESLDYASPGGSPGSPSHNANGSNPLKRPRGPELDRQRKDNHKEVERRRRSAINDGITQLSHIVPGCDAKNTNKGAIIHAAVRYIQDLKHNEASNIEKWTLEKLLMDQAMGDLTAQLDEARREADRFRAELDLRFGAGDGEGQEHQHQLQEGEVGQGEGDDVRA